MIGHALVRSNLETQRRTLRSESTEYWIHPRFFVHDARNSLGIGTKYRCQRGYELDSGNKATAQ